MHQERTYRNQLYHDRLISFRTIVKETDLFIRACMNLASEAKESVMLHRGHIESFIRQHPDFSASLVPLQIPKPVPGIIADMMDASTGSGVGPMAAVAGAIAEYVGHDLLKLSQEIIIENGGDIFIRAKRPVTIGIFADRSPLNMRIGLKIDCCDRPMAVCTSSGTVGHSFSLGTADAVTVVSRSCPVADAAATAIANRVKQKTDVKEAINFGKNIKGVKGLIIIKDDKAGMWGDLNVVRLQQNNG
jgi:ApbE superfamily uncharacterized protein (UPF0280 family)